MIIGLPGMHSVKSLHSSHNLRWIYLVRLDYVGILYYYWIVNLF